MAILDQMVIAAESDYKLTYTVPATGGPQWDFYALGKAMQSEEVTEQLRHGVAQALQRKLLEQGAAGAAVWAWPRALESPWGVLAGAVHSCATRASATSRKGRPGWCVRLAKERDRGHCELGPHRETT